MITDKQSDLRIPCLARVAAHSQTNWYSGSKKRTLYEDGWNSKTLSLQGRSFVEDFHYAPNISRLTLALANINSVVFVFSRRHVPATV